MLQKERPVRLRAYQAGLWGCLTIPGRVGGLFGSAYDFRTACCSSYRNLNTRNPAAKNRASSGRALSLLTQHGAPSSTFSPPLHLPWSVEAATACGHVSFLALPAASRGRRDRQDSGTDRGLRTVPLLPGPKSTIRSFTGVSRESGQVKPFYYICVKI